MRASQPRTAESGNVLFYILIAVALIAALSFAVAQSGRGNVQKLSEERARLYASEIIEYGNILASAVAQTRLRGYDPTEISFENNMVASYTNANCTDDICKIFHPSGAGVNWMSPPSNANDGSEWFFSGRTCIHDVGSSGGGACNSASSDVVELIVFLPNVDETVCVQINDLLGVNNPSDLPPQESSNAYNVGTDHWVGTFAAIYEISGPLTGLLSGCFEGDGPFPTAGTYHYFKTLIAR